MWPKWFRKAIVYQILIDRFAGYRSTDWSKPEFIGGNIPAITEKLDYLKELGVNAIWLSPFYETTAYHGYHITDYMKVEPRFGNLNDIKEFLQRAHQFDIRIIADFVPNHCSNKHPYFQEALHDKSSKYYDWFIFNKWPDDYLCFFNFGELPKLNLDNPDTRDYIINAAKYWLSIGFDGFRIDHVVGVKHSFWRYFRENIKRDYPDSVLIGEACLDGVRIDNFNSINIRKKIMRWIFGISQDSLQREYYGELDGILDFKFQDLIKTHIAHAPSCYDAKTLQEKIEMHCSHYPKCYYLAIFLDNHDMNRFLFECANDKEKLKSAARVQFKLNQPIIIYYGTEVGMTHNSSVQEQKPHADIEARQPMIWKNQDLELFEFYKKLIRDKKKISEAIVNKFSTL